MIVEAVLGYLWLAEPLGWQKEAAARDLLADFGRRWVREEHRHFMDEARCDVRPELFGAEEPFVGMGGFKVTPIRCAYETPCGVVMERFVWHEPLLGAYTTAESEDENIAWQCPEMLRPEVLADVERGG